MSKTRNSLRLVPKLKLGIYFRRRLANMSSLYKGGFLFVEVMTDTAHIPRREKLVFILLLLNIPICLLGNVIAYLIFGQISIAVSVSFWVFLSVFVALFI